MTVVIYARVSSSEQVAGYSIDAQIEQCKNWCIGRGLSVSTVYSELGKSAKTDDRPIFRRMIADLLVSSGVSAVVVHKCDRFARNLLDLLRYKKQLAEVGTSIFSVSEDFLNGSGADVDLVVKIMGATAEYVAYNIGNEAKKGIEQKALSGSYPGSSVPFGYVRVGEKRNSRIIFSSDAGIVSQAFKDFSTGSFTLASWAKEAIRRGYRSSSGGVIGRSSWHLIFRNKFYTGVFIWSGKEFTGNHPALIDDDVFATVQSLLDARNSGGCVLSHFWLLSGLLWSSEFCRPVSGSLVKGKYRYYTCLGRGGSAGLSVKADDLEGQVINLLSHIRLTSRFTSVPDAWSLALLSAGSVRAVYDVLPTEGEKRDLLRFVFPKNSLHLDGSGCRVSVNRLRVGFESI